MRPHPLTSARYEGFGTARWVPETLGPWAEAAHRFTNCRFVIR